MAPVTDGRVRPAVRVLSLAAAVLVGAIASELAAVYFLDEGGDHALSVRVVMKGGGEAAGLQVEGQTVSGRWRPMVAVNGARELRAAWWVRSFRLRASSDVIDAVESVEWRVRDGPVRSVRQEELAAWRRAGEGQAVLQGPEGTPGAGVLDPARYLLNWPPWGSVGGGLLLWPLAVFVLTAIAGLVARGLWQSPRARELLLAISGEERPAAGAEASGRCWLAAALLTVLAGLALLEWRQPLYFLQDDNFVQFLPNLSLAGETLASGRWPWFNPHVLLGAPTFDTGNYAISYPPALASWWLAAKVLGREAWTMEIFCIGHLSGAVLTTFWLGSRLGLSPPLSAALAVSYALSGIMLILGRSWIGVAPVAFFFPLLLVSAERFARGRPGWRWTVATGMTIGVFFHAGNVQFWFYSLLAFLFAIAVPLASGRVGPTRLVPLAAAALIACGLAAPLLAPQLELAQAMVRRGGTGGGIFVGLTALALPYPLASARHPNNWGNVHRELMGHFYYCGTILAIPGLAALALVASSLLALRSPGGFATANVWSLTAMVVFLCALGRQGLIWQWMSALPILEKFREPFKFLMQLHLLLPVAGALVWERGLGAANRRFRGAVFVATALLMLYHCAMARSILRSYYAQPYPPLTGRAERHALPVPGEPGGFRMLTLAVQCEVQRDAPWAWMEGLPTTYGRYSYKGYDWLVFATPENQRAHARLLADPTRAARAYGIRWVFLHDKLEAIDLDRMAPLDWVNTSPTELARLAPELQLQARTLGRDGHVTLWELPGADPMAFLEGGPAPVALAARMHGAGATVELAGPARDVDVVVNLLARPFTRAWVDGAEARVAADDWGRVRVRVGAGSRVLEVGYRTRWQRDLLLGAWLCLAGVLVALAWHRFGLRPGGLAGVRDGRELAG
ncbi:MAG: hypothetical protein HY816_21435 [Candidatus Wallbacteria bacterium]|nr:hypothetical protein [Candidatus Wallbacteria bacterium]